MKFYDINYIKPTDGEIILAKLKHWDDSVNYYVFRTYIKDNEYIFEEACGERYWEL